MSKRQIISAIIDLDQQTFCGIDDPTFLEVLNKEELIQLLLDMHEELEQ